MGNEPFIAGTITLLFLTAGMAIIGYGVNKSREIGGWAVWFVILGWLFFIPASYFFLSGVLGWQL